MKEKRARGAPMHTGSAKFEKEYRAGPSLHELIRDLRILFIILGGPAAAGLRLRPTDRYYYGLFLIILHCCARPSCWPRHLAAGSFHATTT